MPQRIDALELLFVTGKGGTGKTTVAAATARYLAAKGLKVLLCEVDAKGELALAFDVTDPGFEPKEVAPGISLMSMDTESSLREYLRLYLKVPFVGSLGPLAKAFDFVATAAPGVKEILTVGKLCYEVRLHRYDVVVVDAPATGHIIGQLAAPQAINELVKVGLIRSQTEWMLDILSDPLRTGVMVVTTPEEMPVTETIELTASITAATTVALSAVVVNRVLPGRFSVREEEVFERLGAPSSVASLSARLGADLTEVFEGASLAVGLRKSRSQHLSRLREHIDSAVPLVLLPNLFEDHPPSATTQLLATSLELELEQ